MNYSYLYIKYFSCYTLNFTAPMRFSHNIIFEFTCFRREKMDCSDCKIRCRYCDVCPDLYSCTCKDYWVRSGACKHIHLIHKFKFQSNSRPVQCTVNIALSQKRERSMDEMWQEARGYMEKALQTTPKSPALMKSMLEKLKEFNNLHSMDQSSVDLRPVSIGESTRKAPNKLVEPQRKRARIDKQKNKNAINQSSCDRANDVLDRVGDIYKQKNLSFKPL